MCQLPLISMWVSSTRSPEKRISSHLPADSTRSTVRPASGVSTSTRASFGSTVSKRVTVCPPIASCSVRAVRKMVSPSGIDVGFLGGIDYRRGHATHLETERAADEAGLLQQRRQEVLARGRVVDFADQQTGAAPLPAMRDIC